MKLREFLKMVDGLNPDIELFVNNNIVYDVEVRDQELILKYENPLEAYYNYRGKIENLKEMVNTIRKDGIEVISEIEAVSIAKNLDLSFSDVTKAFLDENIRVEVL